MKTERRSSHIPPTNARNSRSANAREEKIPESHENTKMVRVDIDDHSWLRDKAYQERVTMKELVSIVIDNYKK